MERRSIKINELMQLLVFRLKDQYFALPLAAVERVLCAVEVTPLPGAPDIVLGAIDMHGSIIPVLNIRRRFHIAQQELSPADYFLIARSARHAVALVIDEALGVIERGHSAFIGSDQMVPGLEQFQGLVTLDDGLVLIHNLEKFLSLDEARTLDDALERAE